MLKQSRRWQRQRLSCWVKSTSTTLLNDLLWTHRWFSKLSETFCVVNKLWKWWKLCLIIARIDVSWWSGCYWSTKDTFLVYELFHLSFVIRFILSWLTLSLIQKTWATKNFKSIHVIIIVQHEILQLITFQSELFSQPPLRSYLKLKECSDNSA